MCRLPEMDGRWWGMSVGRTPPGLSRPGPLHADHSNAARFRVLPNPKS